MVRFVEGVDAAPGADVYVVAVFVDTTLEEGNAAAHRVLEASTDETLAKYPSATC